MSELCSSLLPKPHYLLQVQIELNLFKNLKFHFVWVDSFVFRYTCNVSAYIFRLLSLTRRYIEGPPCTTGNYSPKQLLLECSPYTILSTDSQTTKIIGVNTTESLAQLAFIKIIRAGFWLSADEKKTVQNLIIRFYTEAKKNKTKPVI